MTTLMFYCQHVLGIGHVTRSLALIEALKEFDVHFVNGGKRIEGVHIPSNISVINLPPLEMDEEFSALHTSTPTQSLEAVQQQRTTILLAEWERIRPDIVVLELFPFGRKRFAPELVPLLARNRLAGSPSTIVSSIRDILVGKSDQSRHEDWVCHVINAYVDMVLVHSDPQFQTLEETFSRTKDLHCDIHHTGFVAQKQPSTDRDRPPDDPHHVPLIVTSIGGGRVGFELVKCAVLASRLLQVTLPHRMLTFCGPNMPDEQYLQLQELVSGQPTIVLQRFTDKFLPLLAKADLSISMAGYNTCMNILTTGVPALVLPFSGHENEEQTIRARKLAARGFLGVLEPHDVTPQVLSEKIRHLLSTPASQCQTPLDTKGADKTAMLLKTIVPKEPPMNATPPQTTVRTKPAPSWECTLRQALEPLRNHQNPIHVFLRDDDSDINHDSLRRLLDGTLSRQVPLTLAAIPGTLQDSVIRLFRNVARSKPSSIEIHQHGWMHHNHEQEGRKCEFGPSRDYREQVRDIAMGKTLLEKYVKKHFFPAFTPPWNRCTADTYKALDALEFKVLSKDQGKQPVTGYRFREISTSIDLYRWKEGPTLKEPEEIVQAFIAHMQQAPPIGLLLHHKVMTPQAFLFLDHLLRILQQYPHVHFHTFQSLINLGQKATIAGARP